MQAWAGPAQTHTLLWGMLQTNEAMMHSNPQELDGKLWNHDWKSKENNR